MAKTAKKTGTESNELLDLGKSKFERNLTLSHSEIRGKRARLITQDAEYAQDELIKKMSAELRKLDRSLLDLEDLHPDHTTSLRVGRDFDAANWVNTIQELKVRRAILAKELEIAIDTQKEFFSV